MNDDAKELALLREWAGGQCALPNVVAELGPLSLWSKDAFEREMAKARAAALEEAAKVADAQAAIYLQKRDAAPMDSETWERRESQRDAAEWIAAGIRSLKTA